ncbi:MAG: hypothetical protein AB7P12_15075, partial [Alphaproteobacteria bacterium]
MTRICSFATGRGTLISIAAAMSLALAGCMSPDGTDTTAQRRSAQDMRAKTLAKLDEVHPGARE